MYDSRIYGVLESSERMGNILILGMGVSGQSALKRWLAMGTTPMLYDDRGGVYQGIEAIRDIQAVSWLEIDAVMKSPGIKPVHPVIVEAQKRGIPVISDVELAYRLPHQGKIVAVTGTNGKTTTTAAITWILNQGGKKAQAVGNIGVGVVDALQVGADDEYHVMELSSFQLAHVMDFKPDVALITNITPDHLDWHETFEHYRDAKLQVMKKQTDQDIAILNDDDPVLHEFAPQGPTVIRFSVTHQVEGWYLDGEQIVCRNNGEVTPVMMRSEIPLVGMHNVENLLGAMAVCDALGMDRETIVRGVRTFQAVAHRIEPVGSIRGALYYNDSKGTNPEASVKAIEAMEGKPLYLIAGGYDKGSDFSLYAQAAKPSLCYVYLLGQTAAKVKEAFLKEGIPAEKLVDVSSLKEAVNLAKKEAKDGAVVLLSPACASWGMYDNYEQRGDEFRQLVKESEQWAKREHN